MPPFEEAYSPRGFQRVVSRFSLEVMEKARFVKDGFDKIAKTYNLANKVLSLGLDSLWRKATVKALGKRARVLDLCCGTLALSREYERQFGIRPIGLDFSLPMLLQGLRGSRGFNVVCGDALRMPFRDEAFDGVMVAFGLRNLSDMWKGLREAYRVLCPGGRIVILEFGRPKGLFGSFYRVYLKKVVPWLGGLLTGNRPLYEYFYRSILSFPEEGKILKGMARLGFKDIKVRKLTFGVCVLYVAEK